MTKMRDSIRLQDGAVVRVGDALARGLLVVRKVERFATRNGKPRTAYFADMPGTSLGVEISRTDYLAHA